MPHSIASTVSTEAVHYFKETLADCNIHYEETHYRINKAPGLIIRGLEKRLREPENIITFINCLKNICESKAELSKALKPCELSTGTNCVEQESILRIFLNTGCLQNQVIELLLDQLTTLACELNGENLTLRLIIKALKFLPFINEAAHFTTRILDLIEISNTSTQRELLNHIPELIPDNQSDEAAKQLSKLLEDCDDLSGSIIDCMNSFNISTDARLNIQEHITKQLLTSTRYYKIFPILFEFLVTDCKQENIVNVLLKTRTTLDNIMRAESNEADSYKALTFKKLESFVSDEKYLFDGFVNMIVAVNDSSEHKPVDVLLLFMLHYICKGRKHIVESVIRKRIKNYLFKVVLIERVFEKYFVQQIFFDYFATILEISGMLLRIQDDAAIMIAGVMFKLLFNNKYSSRTHRQDILYNLMMIMGMKDFKNASVVLKVFNGLLEGTTIREHGVQLMSLLEKVDALDLNNVRLLFEILSSVVCGLGSQDLGLKDELLMFNKKQLSTYEKINKQKGIILAVILAKHSVSIKEMQSLDQSIDSIEYLPDGPAKEAAILLQAANQCANGLPEMLALYYDQLSSMVNSVKNLDPYFSSWLFETVTKDFETMFIVNSPPPPINDLKLTPQYLLNTDVEIENIKAVNIGEMAIKEELLENNNILILAPIFKLLRLLHHKQNDGNLLSIHTLIGYPIIMPEYDCIENLHNDQIKQVKTCVYHCINWFRELISAFCGQKLKLVRVKVIQRLIELTELEETLRECVGIIPEHNLFDCVVILTPCSTQNKRKFKENTKPARKKFKKSTNQIHIARKKGYELNFKFREMDTDTLILLKYPLTISVSNNQTQSITLGLKQFQFLMRNLIQTLKTSITHKASSTLDLNIIDPINLITDCKRIMPMIQKHTGFIAQEIENLLRSVDDRHDVPEMFSKEAEDLKCSYDLILEFYSVLFRWPRFQHAKQQTLLKDCLKNDLSQTITSTGRHIIDFINTISKSSDQCLLLSSAVRMIEIMQALYNIQADQEIRKRIVCTSEKFLKRKWFNLIGKQETGKQSFIHVDVLVKAYLFDANINTICGLVEGLQDDVIKLKSREDYLLMLGSIDKSNFHILFRGLCTVLSERVKIEISNNQNEQLILWKLIVSTMQGLATIAKVQNNKSNLNYFLKKSITILKTFILRGVPIMEIMLKSKPDQVIEIFKIMQASTRFLHHVCCHSKNVKDSVLISQVPQFRLVLETLVYHVKAILIANNCSEAFWMGTLKNRDLEGDDILSQSTNSAIDQEELSLDGSDDDDEADDFMMGDNKETSVADEMFDLEF